MQSNNWLIDRYDDLVAKYAGRWVLIRNNKVIFADKSFNVVYEKSEEICTKPDECLIELVDSGDAAIYGITFPNSED